MRLLMISVALAGLTACSPPPPDSGAGVGFGDYDNYLQERRARDAQLTGNALPAPDAVSSETLEPAEPRSVQTAATGEGADLAAETQAALDERRANSGEAVVHADPSNPPPKAVIGASGISQENSFEAVGAERSIESDAAKIAQNRAQYKVIEAEALPQRSGDGGPNIVDYALATKHPMGTQVYRRIGVNLSSKAERNCAKYPSPDKAQSEFLAKGGPQRDKLGLDPDGDGYACSWDPSPFRKAVGG